MPENASMRIMIAVELAVFDAQLCIGAGVTPLQLLAPTCVLECSNNNRVFRIIQYGRAKVPLTRGYQAVLGTGNLGSGAPKESLKAGPTGLP